MLGSALAPTTADWMGMLSLQSQRSYTTSSETFMLTTLFFNALKKTEGLRGPFPLCRGRFGDARLVRW